MYWLNASKLDFNHYVNVRFKLNELKGSDYESYPMHSELNVLIEH